MIDHLLPLKSRLKQHGYSLTRARVTVFQALAQQHPIDMQSLIATTTSIDRASIYRVIDVFEKIGAVQRIQKGKTTILELTDAFGEHHHHLNCLHCGSTIAIPGSATIEDAIQDIAAASEFTVRSHVLEISGICAACANAPSQPHN